MPMRGQRTLTGRRRGAGAGRRRAPGAQGHVHVDHDAGRRSASSGSSSTTSGGPGSRSGKSGPVVLYDEVGRMLTRAVCAWAGRAAGRLGRGPAHRRAARDDRGPGRASAPGTGGAGSPAAAPNAGSATSSTAPARARLPAPEGSALRVIAEHRDDRRPPLPRRIAAVELLNVLRPTVAVGPLRGLRRAGPARPPALAGAGPRRRRRPPRASCRRYAATTRSSRWRRPGSGAPSTGRAPLPAGPAGAARPVRHQPPPGAVAGAGAVPARSGSPAGGATRSASSRRAAATTSPATAAPGEWITIELMKRAVTNLTTRHELPGAAAGPGARACAGCPPCRRAAS